MATYTKLKSGKWRAQVRKGGSYHGATFNSKKEAKQWTDEIERKITYVSTIGYAPPPKDATLSSLICKYYEMRTESFGRTKDNTLKMIDRKIGKVNLGSLNALVLRDFVDFRIAKGVSGATVASDLSHLSAVLKWARYSRRLDIQELLASDARKSLKHTGLNTRSEERNREPTKAELSKLNLYWKSNPRQLIDMCLIVEFALATGMRLGEIARIRVEDVSSKNKTVIIRDRKDPRCKKGNDQVVPLLVDAWAIVEANIKGRENGLIFNVKAASVSSAFTRACKKLNIYDLRFHDLRHKATADFFRKGLEIPYVAVMTGHKTWAMLKRYTKITALDVHAAYEKLS